MYKLFLLCILLLVTLIKASEKEEVIPVASHRRSKHHTIYKVISPILIEQKQLEGEQTTDEDTPSVSPQNLDEEDAIRKRPLEPNVSWWVKIKQSCRCYGSR